jgi:hypothetical protein
MFLLSYNNINESKIMSTTFYLKFLIIIFFPLNLYSQVLISGQIRDTMGKPVEFAEILLQNTDSVIIKSELTDKTGKFIFKISKGIFKLLIRKDGEFFYQKKIEVIDTIFLGEIIIAYKPKFLDQVIVTAKKKLIERKADRIIFNVENSIVASGGDALDALKLTPGVRVEDDRITIIGKNGIAIMIDDRLVIMTENEIVNLLRSIKSDDLKSIEVITNPPAKYDAQGSAGLINIRYKKVKKDSWNGTTNVSYRQATYPSISVGESFNFQKKRITINNNINLTKGSIERLEKDEIFYPIQTWITNFNKRNYSNLLSGRIGIDYKLSNKWSTGILYFGSKSNPETKENDLGIISNSVTKEVDSLINTSALNKTDNVSHSFNWHNTIKLDTSGWNFSTDIDIFLLKNDVSRDFETRNLLGSLVQTPTGYLSIKSIGSQKLKNYSAKIDFEQPLSFANITYGVKLSQTETDNDIKFYDITRGGPLVLDGNRSDVFNFSEKTQAFYISGNKKIGKKNKWEIQTGLRIERTLTKGISKTLNQVTRNSYLQLFPTAYAEYTHNDNHSFTIDYGRRIMRPGFRSLNPFRFYTNAFNYTEGNPFLLPQFSNNIELKHGFKNVLFSTISYTNETNGIGQVPFVNSSTNIQYFTTLNYFTYNSFGISESYTYNKLSWWESINQMDLFYSKSTFISTVQTLPTFAAGFYISSNNTFTLNKTKTFKAGINTWYSAPGYDLIEKRKGMYSIDVSAKFSLLKKTLLISLVAQDLLKTNKSSFNTFTNNVRQVYSSYSDNRFFRLSASWKFGSKKLNVKRNSFGNEEEKGRSD